MAIRGWAAGVSFALAVALFIGASAMDKSWGTDMVDAFLVTLLGILFLAIAVGLGASAISRPPPEPEESPPEALKPGTGSAGR